MRHGTSTLPALVNHLFRKSDCSAIHNSALVSIGAPVDYYPRHIHILANGLYQSVTGAGSLRTRIATMLHVREYRRGEREGKRKRERSKERMYPVLQCITILTSMSNERSLTASIISLLFQLLLPFCIRLFMFFNRFMWDEFPFLVISIMYSEKR